MSMYHKIPVEVDARQWDASQGLEAAQDLALWCGGVFTFDDNAGQEMKTYYWSIVPDRPDGFVTAHPSEYIINHPGGGFSTMSAKQFEATYEKSTK